MINFDFEILYSPEFKINFKPNKPIIKYEVKADKKMIDNQLKNIVDNLLLTDLRNSDISVMFRFKKKMNNMNNFIKDKGVNEFSPSKKVFIINEKLPKPLVSNDIDPQLVLNCLPTQPSHYKLQAWLNNKPTVIHYRGSDPTGLDNCANL